jgi:putative heme iron utilization protein
MKNILSHILIVDDCFRQISSRFLLFHFYQKEKENIYKIFIEKTAKPLIIKQIAHYIHADFKDPFFKT